MAEMRSVDIAFVFVEMFSHSSGLEIRLFYETQGFITVFTSAHYRIFS
jgi:hypothetical protein